MSYYMVSVVAPVFNERDTVAELVRRIATVLDDVGARSEIILVNDGSSDGSIDVLRTLIASYSNLKVVDLSRNFGHQAAMYAGICHSAGDVVILMDGDLQDPPELIPRMLELWQEGNSVVYAVRHKRKEGLLKRLAYATYYRLLQKLAYITIPLDTGDFSLIDRRVADLLKQMPERNKFLRGLRSWVGFKQVALPYDRDARYAGEPKYTLRKLVQLALDGVVSYSFVPLRVSFVFGATISGASFVLAMVYFTQRIFTGHSIPPGFTTIAVLVLFLGGIQLLTIGLLGEYIGRIYDEVKRRPEFVEREVIGTVSSSDRIAAYSTDAELLPR
jgi:polyisoprenyl-phosphate glycosyltransferase